MSLGVDERSPSAAEASEMTEGWREWQGLILTTAECATYTHVMYTHAHAHTHTHVEKNPTVSKRKIQENPLLVC